jgi:GNAT superfamily N-acetyltransferase
MMTVSNFRCAAQADADNLTSLFIGNLKEQPEYISHGEMQMNVGTSDGNVTPNASEIWKEYILGKIANPNAQVFVYEENGKIVGFTVIEIDDDGGKPFGVICDLFVLAQNRAKGLGSKLFDEGMSWLRGKGITDFYLESCIKNDAAHLFFEKRGFKLISHVYHGHQTI